MSFLNQIMKSLYAKLFPEETRRTFSEEPTRPLDAAALARALAGEGRSHVSSGYASYSAKGDINSRDSLFLMIGNSDGLKVLPDFGIACIADSPDTTKTNSSVSQIAVASFSKHIIQSALLEFFELESYEEASSLQDMVADAMRAAEEALEQKDPNLRFSLTTGLIFAEIIILGHRGMTKAYHLDRHHIEMITVDRWREDVDNQEHVSSGVGASPDEGLDQVTVFSRPVPRDGYILLCTEGLWRNVDEQRMSKIIIGSTGPQEGCDALLHHAKNINPDQNASAILIYFPPDFGSWR